MYSKSVERANPGCIIFLVDQSFSMTDGIGGSERPKIEVVAKAINRFMGELITMCEKGEDKPRYYFDIGAIGYTTDKTGVPIIGSLFTGLLAGRDLASVVELYDNPLDVENQQRDDGQGGLVDFKFPIWYRPPSPDNMAGTPMCGVMQRCYQILSDWCLSHPGSFPPVILNLTDGESTDGNPEPMADQVKSLSTQDGEVLLFNCHLSSSQAESVLLPSSEQQLADEYARILFNMSSVLPEKLRQTAEVKGLPAFPGSRGMAFNADSTSLLKLISVGTAIARPDNLR